MFPKTTNLLSMFTLIAAALFLTIQTAAPQAKDPPPQSNSPAPRAKVSAGLQLLTDPEGVDLSPCLRQVCISVRNSWYAIMPPSAEKGEQGVNSVEFHVLQNGTVPKDSVKMTSPSGKSTLDATSLQAVREASPVNRLPEKFSQPFIALPFTFYYNLKPPTL